LHAYNCKPDGAPALDTGDGLSIGKFAVFFSGIVADTPDASVTIFADSFQKRKKGQASRLAPAPPATRECLQISRQKWYRAAIVSPGVYWM
jgi:hypothetical protein